MDLGQVQPPMYVSVPHYFVQVLFCIKDWELPPSGKDNTIPRCLGHVNLLCVDKKKGGLAGLSGGAVSSRLTCGSATWWTWQRLGMGDT